jgi:hypothetical protein
VKHLHLGLSSSEPVPLGELMHTVAVIRTDLHGPEADEDLKKREFTLRQVCRDQGFILDGGYLQKAFDLSCWPFKALSLALDEDVPIIVVDSLGDITTHNLAPALLPRALMEKRKKLYSVSHRRLFEPLDEDFQNCLREAYEDQKAKLHLVRRSVI